MRLEYRHNRHIEMRCRYCRKCRYSWMETGDGECDIIQSKGVVDMDKKEYVSFYRLVKEMAEEEGQEFSKYNEMEKGDKKDELEEKFRSYKKSKLDYFKDILRTNGLNYEKKYKVGEEYQIPIEEKEAIKFMIWNSTSKYYKKVRKGREPKFEDIKEIVEKAEKYIGKRYKGAEASKQLKSIYRVTGLKTKLRREGIYDDSLKMIKSSISRILVYEDNVSLKDIWKTNQSLSKFKESDKEIDYIYKNTYSTKNKKVKFLGKNEKVRFLSEDDCIILENAYREMISILDKEWNRLADLVEEQRHLETDEEEIITPKRSAQVLYEAIELLIIEKKKSGANIKEDSRNVIQEGIDQIMLELKNEHENKK